MKKTSILFTIAIIITSSSIGQKIGIGTNSPSNTLEVVSSVSGPATASIAATNTGTIGNAIRATSNAANTIAVIGSSTNGWGIEGYTNNNIAISGFSSTGTALYAYSTTGYAMQVNGNLKISGGNIAPSQGAILTSDAAGNATWRKSNVAFLCEKVATPAFAPGTFKKVEFEEETYDLQNNFTNYAGTVTTSSGVFTAPVAGTYHFSSSMYFFIPGSNIMSHAQIRIIKNSTPIASFIGHPYDYDASTSSVELQINGDFHLNVNDKIWIEAAQYSSSTVELSTYFARFSGHIIVTD